MEAVGLATLITTPRPVTDLGNVSPLWHGDALAEGVDVRLYLKRAAAEEMLSECLCAVLGMALGLPVARVFLVADPGALAGGGLLIGSLDAGMPSLRHQVAADAPAVMAALALWPGLYEAALFDEWIANPDRNQGNLLWDAAGDWRLIDHARALGAWPPGAAVPAPNARCDNQLARVLYALHGELALMRARRKIGDFGARARAALAPSEAAVPVQRLKLSARTRAALSFLASRIDWLPALIARHGQQPELPL